MTDNEYKFKLEDKEYTFEEFMNVIDNEPCRCGSNGELPYTCPYAEEIGGDSNTLCNCCDDCSNQCAMDI